MNLNRKTLRCRTYYLVRWQDYASADDSWELVEHVAHCQERVAEYEEAAPRHPQAKALQARQTAPSGTAPPPAGVHPLPPVVTPPPVPLPGWSVAAAAAGSLALGAAITGMIMIPYSGWHWQDEPEG